MVATTLSSAPSRAGYFYVWMAGICALIAFGGFAETYWLQLIPGTFTGSPLLHLHGALFSAWTLLFLSQTWLASQGRLDHHRAWGLVGISLATAMVFVGSATAITNMVGRLARDGDAARGFLIVPLSALGVFAIFFAAAVADINRSEWHKRFMLVATASLLQAAVARFFFIAATGGGPGARPGLAHPPPMMTTVMGGLLVDLLVVAGAVYDWRTRGRPHPAYLIGLAVLLASQFMRLPISTSPTWYAIADSLGRIAG